MSCRELLKGSNYNFITIDGIEYYFTELSKSQLFDRFSGKGYPVSGVGDFLCILAERQWYKGADVICRLKDAEVFKALPRPKGKRLTVAVYYHGIANGGAQRITAMLADIWAERKNTEGVSEYKVILLTDEPKPSVTESVEEIQGKEANDSKDGSDAAVSAATSEASGGTLTGAGEVISAFDYSRFDSGVIEEYNIGEKVIRAYLPPYTESLGGNYRARYDAWNKIITEYEIDVVVSGLWSENCTFWDMLTVKSHPNHPAFIMQNHNFCCLPFRYEGDTALRLARMYSMSDAVVTLSELDKRYVFGFTGRAKYIPNPIGYDDNTPLSAYTPETLIWVGRLVEDKRPGDAIRAVNLVREKYPSVRLFIVGTGSHEMIDSLNDQIIKLGLEENVKLVGFTRDVERYYANASVFISTSVYEGFPTTFSEAFSFGVPIVTYEMPWLTFSQDGRGILPVEQGNYEALAQKVTELLDDPQRIRSVGADGRQKIREIAGADIAKAWDDLFREVTAARNEVFETDILLKYITEYQQVGKAQLADSYNGKIQKLTESRNEINKKLQRTYKEKSEINARLNRTNAMYNAIVNSRSYRIGRLITLPGRMARQVISKLLKR